MNPTRLPLSCFASCSGCSAITSLFFSLQTSCIAKKSLAHQLKASPASKDVDRACAQQNHCSAEERSYCNMCYLHLFAALHWSAALWHVEEAANDISLQSMHRIFRTTHFRRIQDTPFQFGSAFQNARKCLPDFPGANMTPNSIRKRHMATGRPMQC